MTSQRTRVELKTATTLFEQQWQAMRSWLGRIVDDDDAAGLDAVMAAPGVLPGFTVADLISYVGHSLDVLALTDPAEPGVLPLSLAEYLGAYRDRSESAARAGRQYAAEISPAPLRALDRIASAAFHRITDLGPDDRVVQTRRAPIMLSGLVVSRLIELVMYGDDLGRSVAWPGAHPVNVDALSYAAEALLGIVVARGGWSLEVADPLLWVRLATGRMPYEVDRLAKALQARFTSDSVPDLGLMLPLL